MTGALPRPREEGRGKREEKRKEKKEEKRKREEKERKRRGREKEGGSEASEQYYDDLIQIKIRSSFPLHMVCVRVRACVRACVCVCVCVRVCVCVGRTGHKALREPQSLQRSRKSRKHMTSTTNRAKSQTGKISKEKRQKTYDLNINT